MADIGKKIKGAAEEGAKVSYEATQGKKGMQAENVTPV
jgi:cold shock CspA family protein